jgi:predicted NAD/FAD-binding protein
MRIAIIGGGISGLAAAYLLNRRHRVDLFEANDYVGGHSNTVAVYHNGQPLAIDIGFIVYNEHTYPNLTRLFDELDVPTQYAPMSFSLTDMSTGWEYGTRTAVGIFAKPTNALRPKYWRFLADFGRFFKAARLAKDDPTYDQMTLDDFLTRHRLSDVFRQFYIVPMVSAIWSSPLGTAAEFPARYMMRFYDNHGLLEVNSPVKWRTVTGGSQVYVQKILHTLRGDICTSTPVHSVERHADGVTLQLSSGQTCHYDHVVITTHSDQALRLLADPSDEEREILGAIPYETGTAVLHTDEALLPRRRTAWAAWNYMLKDEPGTDQKASLTYWMNELQTLNVETNYFVTMNPVIDIEPDKVIARIQYAHPVYTLDSLAARRRLPEINGKRHTHYAGAYFSYGFHEDGMKSGVDVARDLGIEWDTAPTNLSDNRRAA